MEVLLMPLNGEFIQSTDVIGDLTDWSASQVVTNMVVGNGTMDSKYNQTGELVFWRVRFVLGTTSTMGTSVLLTPPVSPVANAASSYGLQMRDTSVPANFHGITTWSGGFIVLCTLAAAQTSTTAATPFVWATGDSFAFTLWYEAA
jgi:hypothetical protein